MLNKFFSTTFIKYGIMAVIVVGIEIASFWIFNSLLDIHYLVATWLSLLIGIVLNWIGSRYFVFGFSKHKAHKEFVLVAVTSLFGLALQSATVAFMVEIASQDPIIGKILAIIVTFFWNYFIREKYIYRHEEKTK